MSITRQEITHQEIQDFILQLKWNEVSTIWEDVLTKQASLKFAVSLQNPDTFVKVAMKLNQWNAITPVRKFKEMIDEKDANGNTKLHRAVMKNDIETVKLLLSYCASTIIFNHANQKPLDVALNAEMRKLIAEHILNQKIADLSSLNNINTQFSNKAVTNNNVTETSHNNSFRPPFG